MKLKTRLFGLGTAVLIVSIGLIVFSASLRPAPDISLSTINGRTLTLGDLRGQPVIVTFWASDCPVCIEEIPHLAELYERFHPDGLEIIGIAMYYDPPNHVVDMTRAKQIPYTIALDLRAQYAKAFGDVRFTPNTFLIDTDGHIAWHQIGAFDPAEMKRRIEALLHSS